MPPSARKGVANVTVPEKKRSGIVGICAGVALMDKSSKPRWQIAARGGVNVTVPEKKRSGTVVKERRLHRLERLQHPLRRSVIRPLRPSPTFPDSFPRRHPLLRRAFARHQLRRANATV